MTSGPADPGRSIRRAWGSRAALGLGGAALALVAAEILLRLLGLPTDATVPRRFDPVLLHRVSPRWNSEVDATGFRNPAVPDRADVVVLGDSHTWGWGVDAAHSWPVQFSRLTALRVYSLGMGGYGPLQYYALAARAIAMQPEVLAIGLYLANDVTDICRTFLALPSWQDRAAHDGLDLGHCEEFRVQLRDRPVAPLAIRARWGPFPDLPGWVREARTVALLAAARTRWAPETPGDVLAEVRDGRNDTRFSRRKLTGRARLQDPLPVIEGSHRILQVLLGRIADRAGANGIQTVVLFLPSKELVLRGHLARQGPLPDAIDALTRLELEDLARVQAFLDRHGIAYVDARPWVEAAVARSGGVYARSDDGHPREPGYRAYATALYEGFWPRRQPD